MKLQFFLVYILIIYCAITVSKSCFTWRLFCFAPARLQPIYWAIAPHLFFFFAASAATVADVVAVTAAAEAALQYLQGAPSSAPHNCATVPPLIFLYPHQNVCLF